MRTFVAWSCAAGLMLGLAGCDGGGSIQEGVPPNAGYTPPKEQPSMKPVSKSEIAAKKKAGEATAEPEAPK
jgi:hypothetical protein